MHVALSYDEEIGCKGAGDLVALLAALPEEKRAALLGVLRNDPRPAYQHDPGRVYALEFAGHTVRFTVDGNMLTVREVL